MYLCKYCTSRFLPTFVIISLFPPAVSHSIRPYRAADSRCPSGPLCLFEPGRSPSLRFGRSPLLRLGRLALTSLRVLSVLIVVLVAVLVVVSSHPCAWTSATSWCVPGPSQLRLPLSALHSSYCEPLPLYRSSWLDPRSSGFPSAPGERTSREPQRPQPLQRGTALAACRCSLNLHELWIYLVVGLYAHRWTALLFGELPLCLRVCTELPFSIPFLT